ncbi:ribosome-inactivating family protein [Streptomyces monomycini]|uniref:ribosome-inactivating family protein n=1 Tax=Streptomyces monomycini TaxID=371720 RepID=UPI0004AB10CE|nr:ribosome-inactivating family protein [Streptomyces monomycini]
MHPISAVRGVGRRIGVLCLALFAACGLLNGNATPAHADTTQPWTVIEWDITGMKGKTASPGAASNYRAMVARLRDISSHQILNDVRESMPQGTGRYIEVRVRDRGAATQHRLSLYLRADNLYLDGFTVQGQNYSFREAPREMVTGFSRFYRNQGNMLFDVLPYTGHYRDLAESQARSEASYDASHMFQYLDTMTGLTENNWYGARSHIAFVIGATSEAARFGWIENRIARSIHAGSDYDGEGSYSFIGGFGVDLENNWERLSRIVHAGMNNESLPAAQHARIAGRIYANLHEIQYGTTRNNQAGPRIAPFITLYGA